MEEAMNWREKSGRPLIREARTEDCRQIGELALELIRLEHSLNEGTGEPTPWAGSAAEIRKQMARPSTKFLVAERDGTLIGYAKIDLHGINRGGGRLSRLARQLFDKLTRRPRASFFASGGVISGILVAATERRTRVGHQLVEAAAEWLRLQGVSQVYIHVLQNNLPALRFWEGSGFEPVTIVLRKELK